MSGLALFWTVVFFASVGLFLLVEVVVLIGGAANIADMVRSLLAHREEVEHERG